VRPEGRRSLGPLNRRYGTPAKVGQRITADGKPGTIIAGCGHHLRIRLDGEKHAGTWHPLWHIDYGDGIDYGMAYDERIKAFNRALIAGYSISDDEHREIGRILGYPACCVEEWIADRGTRQGDRRGSNAGIRRRTPAEIADLTRQVSELLGRDWTGVRNDPYVRYVPCSACMVDALVRA
jgi:hypothetical protein